MLLSRVALLRPPTHLPRPSLDLSEPLVKAPHDRLRHPVDQVLPELAQSADLARSEAFLLQLPDARRHDAARSAVRGSRLRLRPDFHLVPTGAESGAEVRQRPNSIAANSGKDGEHGAGPPQNPGELATSRGPFSDTIQLLMVRLMDS